MVEKTLSTGTMSLRFMQNARRAQQHPQEHPPVKDDTQWEVAHTAYRGEKAVTYETSYLPFLFPSLHDTPAAGGPSSLSPSNTLPPRGRRIFNKRGHEITQEASSPPTDTAPQQNIDQEAPEPSKNSRPLSISSSAVPAPTARHSKKSYRNPSKDAKNLIFDTTGIGADLRHPSLQGTTFRRPAGVDAPPDSNPTKTASHPTTGAITSPKSKLKRSRTSGEPGEPKKKSRLTLIE